MADFLAYVGTGRMDEVRAMLAAMPALVNAVGPHPFWGGRPQALHVAIEAGRHDLFDLLLAHGADVNGSNDEYDRWSPLMIAIHRRRQAMVDELLRRDAHVGLVEALMLGNDGRVEALLDAGGLPDTAPNGGSMLAFARTPFAVDRLLALGVPTDLEDRWGSTPMDVISRLGPPGQALARHMIARGIGAGPEAHARLGDLDTLVRICQTTPSVAARESVLFAAVDGGHHTIVEWLLARGASANARSSEASRHTALHSAAWNGDLRMVRLLVEAGADVTARDDQYNATPIGWATTASEVSNHPECTAVAAYLRTVSGNEA